jgi:glycosyltransferase involved in cell wall biosynthesis
VNLAAFDAAQPEDVRQRFEVDSRAPLLVFHGALSYLPNRKALRVVSEVLLPGLDGQGLAAHLLAVGRDPPNVSPHPRMHFSGSVAEIAPWLKAADIAVIPLTEGGGTRMKILDCFAAGLPVISTSKGVEGIPVSHGEEVLVIDDWPSFIEAIAELWRDRERAAALAQRGRDFAGKLDWSEIARRYGQLYASVQR